MGVNVLFRSKDPTATAVSVDNFEAEIVDGIVAIPMHLRHLLDGLKHRFTFVGVEGARGAAVPARGGTVTQKITDPPGTENVGGEPASDGLDDPPPPHIADLAK
jgi:hypothetical protein